MQLLQIHIYGFLQEAFLRELDRDAETD